MPVITFTTTGPDNCVRVTIAKDLGDRLDVGIVILAHPDERRILAGGPTVRELEERLTIEE